MLSIFSRAPIFLYFFIFAVIYIAFFYIAIFKNKFVQKIIYLFFRFLHKINLVSRKKYRRIVKYSFEHIELFSKDLALFLKGNPWYVILSILFTLLFLLAEFSFAILIMSGMGYQVNYLSVILMQFVVVFFMYFAPTPGATGVAEGGFSLLFAQFVDKKDIFPLIFSWRLFTKYIGIGIGIVLFLILLFKGDRDHEEN